MSDNLQQKRYDFQYAIQICNVGRQSQQSIGLLQEKSIHTILKHTISTDITQHEYLVDTQIADVFKNNILYEIQTANFDKMRSKIKKFTKHYPLHIIYPIPSKKTICWYDQNHQLIKKNKSPKKGRIYDALKELYKIKPLLNTPNLHLDLYFIEMEELKTLDGYDITKKKGATKIDRLPLQLDEIISFNTPMDYLKFLPYNLTYPFTNKDLSKAAKITLRQATIITLVLKELNLIKKIGTLQRSYLYDLI